MDIKKYIKNKDIELSNDDINIDKLESDLRKGFISQEEVDERVSKAVEEIKTSSKTEYDKLKSQYDELQNNVADYEKRNTDLAEKNKSLSLENVMTRAGFKEEDFKDISAMRYSMYGDLDDVKAIQSIKEKYVNTYFPTKEEKPKDDLPINNGVTKPVEPKVNRKTSIRELLKK